MRADLMTPNISMHDAETIAHLEMASCMEITRRAAWAGASRGVVLVEDVGTTRHIRFVPASAIAKFPAPVAARALAWCQETDLAFPELGLVVVVHSTENNMTVFHLLPQESHLSKQV